MRGREGWRELGEKEGGLKEVVREGGSEQGIEEEGRGYLVVSCLSFHPQLGVSRWELNLLLLLRMLEILSKENFRNCCDFVSFHLPFCNICPWVFQIYCWISTPTPPHTPTHLHPLLHSPTVCPTVKPWECLFCCFLFFVFFCTEPEKGPKCRHHSDVSLFWGSGMPIASSLPMRTSATNSTQLQVKCHGIWGCSSPRGPVRSPCLGILHLNFGGIHYCPSKAWLFSLYYSVFPFSCLFPLFPQSKSSNKVV